MKLYFVLPLALIVAACNGNDGLRPLPAPPQNTTVVTRDVPVPVLCRVEIQRAQTAIDHAQEGMQLEPQNAMLRQTIAEQRAYIATLESGLIGCGGKITNR